MGNSLKTLIAKWWLKAKGLVSKDALRLQKNVWLTFDDGPQPQNTELILETLEQHKLKATFFFIGKYVEQYPDIVLRVAEAGHRIGNHTHSHPHLSKLSADAVKAEIEKAERLIAPYQGPGSKLFRPPYGDRNRTVDSIVQKLGYRLVMWTVDTKDWRSENQPRGWMEYGIRQMRWRKSCVILNHDIQTTAQNLDEFIRCIIALGNVSFQSPWTL